MRKQIWLALFIAVVLAAGPVHAAKKITVELGKELFNDPKLGGSTNESSCSSCHAGGKGLENSLTKKKFSKLVNKCLVGQMDGNKIDGRKAAMRSIKLYIKSLEE